MLECRALKRSLNKVVATDSAFLAGKKSKERKLHHIEQLCLKDNTLRALSLKLILDLLNFASKLEPSLLVFSSLLERTARLRGHYH